MTQINLNWDDFKSFINARSLSIQYLIVNDSYALYAFDGPFNVSCFILLSDLIAVADFETNYKSNGNKQFTSSGHQIMAPTLEYDLDLRNIWKGYKYTAIAGAQSFFDEQVTQELKLRGGWYALLDSNAAVGDYVEFSIIDKDDVLGYFQYYGLTVGQDILELSKFVRTDYVNPTSFGRQEFAAASASDVVAGLYLRTTYKSVGSSNVTFKIVIRYLEV